MMRTAISLAVLVATTSALTPEQYARVAAFHGDVVARNAHVEPEVPLEVRGANFTVPNLVKYFSFEAEPAPEEPVRIRGLPKASIDPQTCVSCRPRLNLQPCRRSAGPPARARAPICANAAGSNAWAPLRRRFCRGGGGSGRSSALCR